ncbi:hypothetical protein UY3_11711 [Chelonia mydas]|uniref:Uncharacterized protein n=1 Tax=Chelonia mydas TaxID=8469 RepID=M7B266_CHEMY|nr:hypothetical protein UY3_11711 [Chelonia mydas]
MALDPLENTALTQDSIIPYTHCSHIEIRKLISQQYEKVGEVTSFIGSTSVGERDKLSSHTELFFSSEKGASSFTAKCKVEQIV